MHGRRLRDVHYFTVRSHDEDEAVQRLERGLETTSVNWFGLFGRVLCVLLSNVVFVVNIIRIRIMAIYRTDNERPIRVTQST